VSQSIKTLRHSPYHFKIFLEWYNKIVDRKYLPVIILIVIIVALSSFFVLFSQIRESTKLNNVNNFEECKAAGGAILESFPEQCLLNGKTWTRDIKTDNTKPEPQVPQSNINVTSPKPGDTLDFTLKITGTARVFENAFAYRLLDQNGKILISGFGTANAPDIGQFGQFEITAYYPAPTGNTGTLQVYSNSAKDGSEINKVVIPVVFPEERSREVSLFFSSTKEDPSSLNCEITYPVKRRVPFNNTPAEETMNQLLMGPTTQEQQDGYSSNISKEVRINKLTIQDETAKVDFNEKLKDVAGSCKVQAIRSQIENTLKQFNTVQNVEISINGSTEEVLQP
jgi:hypothetical protein